MLELKNTVRVEHEPIIFRLRSVEEVYFFLRDEFNSSFLAYCKEFSDPKGQRSYALELCLDLKSYAEISPLDLKSTITNFEAHVADVVKALATQIRKELIKNRK